METIKLHQFREKLELLGYSGRAQRDYPEYVRLFFEYLEREEDVHSVNDITPKHIMSYHTWLQYVRRKNGRYLCTSTVRRRLGCVKTFYQVMHREQLIEDDLSGEIVLPKRRGTLPRHVPNEKQMQSLLDSIRPVNTITARDRAMLELLYATGLRNEELRSLVCDSLDLTEKTLFVSGKGSKDRIVPVGDWVMPWVVEYLEAVRPRLVNRREPAGWLFLSKNGRMLTNGNLGDLIKKYVRRAGLAIPLTPHSFRHACATHLLRAGADIRYVQELLGHADLSATQIYTKIDITFLKQAHKRYHPRERQDEYGS